jgi:Trk-type K+ transport system membrane component
MLIIPSSWGSQLGGYPAHIKLIFWRRCRGKRRLLQGEFRTHILYFVLVLLYFIFACIVFIKNTKKLVSLILAFICLLLVLLE